MDYTPDENAAFGNPPQDCDAQDDYDPQDDHIEESDSLEELSLEELSAGEGSTHSGRTVKRPLKWKKRRRPPRRNRRPSRPESHIGQRNNGRLKRL